MSNTGAHAPLPRYSKKNLIVIGRIAFRMLIGYQRGANMAQIDVGFNKSPSGSFAGFARARIR